MSTLELDNVSFISKKSLKMHIQSEHTRKIKCESCDQTFKKNCDLESHIERIHDLVEKFKCDKCDKCFVLNWRRDKHMKLHTNASVKPCHYFNNGGKCPFEELGCKFLHIVAKLCKSGIKCQRRLCPYRHPEKEANKGNLSIIDSNVGR